MLRSVMLEAAGASLSILSRCEEDMADTLQTESVAADQLKALIERIERLEEEKGGNCRRY